MRPRPFRRPVLTVASGIKLFIEYADMAAYGARTAFENANAEWKRLFEARPDSPERLVSVELLSEFQP